jgi:hypothetical protein
MSVDPSRCQCCTFEPLVVGPLNDEGICSPCATWLAKRAKRSAENKALRDREPLVQEVIKRLEEYRGNPTDAGPLMNALVALAEWKPT